MGNLSITVACGNYDRTLPIRDGRVPLEGCDVTFIGLELTDSEVDAVMTEG